MKHFLVITALLLAIQVNCDCNLESILPEKVILTPDSVQNFIEASDKVSQTALFLHSKNNTLCRAYLEELLEVYNAIQHQPQVMLGVIDVDRYGEIAKAMELTHFPALYFAGDTKNLVEYSGLFIAEHILQHINAPKAGFQTIKTVDDWNKATASHDVIVLGSLLKIEPIDDDFFTSLPSIFEGHYKVYRTTSKEIRDYLVAEGYANDTIHKTDYLFAWRRFTPINAPKELRAERYYRLLTTADFDDVFSEYTRYAGYLQLSALPIFDYYTEARYMQVSGRLPILFVYGNFLEEKQLGEHSLLNRIKRLIAFTREYAERVYVLYVETGAVGDLIRGLPVSKPTIGIEDSNYKLQYMFQGDVNSNRQLQQFVDDFLSDKLQPFYRSENPSLYSSNQTKTSSFLVGSTVKEFVLKSSGDTAFVLGYWDKSEDSPETRRNYTKLAERYGRSNVFGLLNVYQNAFPSKELCNVTNYNYFTDFLVAFKGHSLDNFEVFEGNLTITEDVKSWIDACINAPQHSEDL